VEDFAGLYPAWPIIEVAILPTGNAKEERMNMFVKCITALFGEILYVDYSACIAPLEITDDKNDNYIFDKAQLPTSAIGRQAASGVNSCASGPTANATPAGANGTAPVSAAGSQIPACTGNDGRVDGGPVGK
jgi:hypothetical protein